MGRGPALAQATRRGIPTPVTALPQAAEIAKRSRHERWETPHALLDPHRPQAPRAPGEDGRTHRLGCPGLRGTRTVDKGIEPGGARCPYW
ncbi:hypothetical protein GCM10022402_46050 [Salinactinospora qingdaonensis]|uniref:Uncharacterized protein n=1 Tax=Salinactinospora qingdaonensis TaxID=702744 RepID=A0ABP7GHK8_9ACTN